MGTVFLVSAFPASAHQHRHVKGLDTTVGWLNEPAYAGFQNGVQFIVERPRREVGGEEAEHTHEEAGRPVTNATLEVEVLFGGQDATQKVGPLALRAAFGTPGEYRSAIIPTEPGTYTFHIFGTVGKVAFDEYYTSGEAGANDRSVGTFNDIQQPEDISFPGRAPTSTDLFEQVATVNQVASDADGAAGSAMVLGIIGIVVGALAFVTSLMRKRPASG
jgi:hypothetical protein